MSHPLSPAVSAEAQAAKLQRLLPGERWRADELLLFDVRYNLRCRPVGPVQIWLPDSNYKKQLAILLLGLENAIDVQLQRVAT
ncbi:MAG TPA: hypothetical protein VD865_14700 [Stenotrophomonas sp.]|nr:hypothetical protein [Stenotrophomonas sp.]